MKFLLPNHSQTDFNKMNIIEIFKALQRRDLKTIYKLKLKGENSSSNRSVILKITKIDESNQL